LATAANIWRVERRIQQAQEPAQTPAAATKEADAVRLARLRRDLALTPAQRLEKFAALCRQMEFLRGARRLP
jgi:hypothetical protein